MVQDFAVQYPSIPLPNTKSKIPVLITCNHILPESKLQIGNEILIIYDNNKQDFSMTISYNSKIYINSKLDVTIIEMDGYNDITNQLIFMDIDEDIFNSTDTFYAKIL